jgi:hypothetical protein
MSTDTKSTKKEQTVPAGMSSCVEMMGKMFDSESDGLSCESVLSRFLDGDEIPTECAEMISAMDSCCGR